MVCWPRLVEAWKEKGFDKDKVEVYIAPTALHMGSVKAPLESLGDAALKFRLGTQRETENSGFYGCFVVHQVGLNQLESCEHIFKGWKLV